MCKIKIYIYILIIESLCEVVTLYPAGVKQTFPLSFRKRLLWNAVPTVFNVRTQPPSIGGKRPPPKLREGPLCKKVKTEGKYESTIQLDNYMP